MGSGVLKRRISSYYGLNYSSEIHLMSNRKYMDRALLTILLFSPTSSIVAGLSKPLATIESSWSIRELYYVGI